MKGDKRLLIEKFRAAFELEAEYGDEYSRAQVSKEFSEAVDQFCSEHNITLEEFARI